MGIGLWAVFDMLCIWLNNKPAAFLISYTWYFSSILIFYTPNFLPDTASLAFMLLALRQWFLHNADSSYRRIVWFTIFAALACLIKVTSLVFVISIVSLSVLDFLKTRKKTNFIGASLIIFILVFGWYFYGHWLEKQVGGSYFLMNMAVPSSIAQLKAWFHIFYSNWFAQIYNYPQWVVIGLGIVSVPFVKEKLAPRLFACIALLGAVCIYLLMAGQFCYHDYYSITLLPVFLFFMVFCFKWIYDFKPLWSYILIFGVCIWSFAVAKKNHRLRYSPGHYSYQTFFEPSDFKGVDEWLTKNSVTKNDKVLAAFDPNPNTMLYFLERRGCRTFDHTQSYVNGKLLLDTNLVTNDSLQFFKQYPASRDQIKLKSTFNKWTLYKLK